MTHQDFKLYVINSITLGISVTDVEMALKIVLLVASIGYTLQRWSELRKEKKKNKDG